jgi:hypothetical protein
MGAILKFLFLAEHCRVACIGEQHAWGGEGSIMPRGSSMPGERGNIMTRGRSMPKLPRARGSSKLGEQYAQGEQHAL